MKLLPTATPQHADPIVDRTRRTHGEAIKQLQGAPAVHATVIPDVALVDGKVTRVPHTLGRAPVFVSTSPPRGAVTAGVITEVRDGIDRTRIVGLMAVGFGATIATDVEIM